MFTNVTEVIAASIIRAITARTCRTLVNFFHTTLCYNKEDSNLVFMIVYANITKWACLVRDVKILFYLDCCDIITFSRHSCLFIFSDPKDSVALSISTIFFHVCNCWAHLFFAGLIHLVC